MARELTEKAKAMAELAAQAAAETSAPSGPNTKALDTEGATPTVTMGGILLMQRLLVARDGREPAIQELEVPFLHLWVSRQAATRKGRRELGRISRQSPDAIADLFYEWLFEIDFATVQKDVEAIAASLGAVAENSAILDAAGGEPMEDDDPNVPG